MWIFLKSKVQLKMDFWDCLLFFMGCDCEKGGAMYHGMIGSKDNCVANSLVELRSQQEFDSFLRLFCSKYTDHTSILKLVLSDT